LFCISSLSHAESDAPKAKQADITDLDVVDLLKIQVIAGAKKSQVVSVSKKNESLSNAPAAVFVISNDDIKRSGVTSVPEALRMAPGIDVARVNSNKWAITSRGFNGSFANKLLVLIDGRSVYNPAFSGVYWDAQDVLLEDVDRIEVIRGPGATLWGANAVNGVINIITKRAEDTQGGLLTAGGGTQETGFGALRYGKKLTKDSYGRVYIKGFQRNNFKTSDGDNAGDSWDKQQGGFRVDSRLSNQDELTVQGDLYRTNMNQAAIIPGFIPPFQQSINDKIASSGGNITSRFRHIFSTTAEYTLQFYYDHTQRDEFSIQQSLDTLDADFQNSFRLSERQNTIWGLGYRNNMDKFSTSSIAAFNPNSRNTQLFTAFVQDEITLIDEALWFTLGSKFEHNDYSGFEGQPTARLMWMPSPRQRIWTSVSRAVRTPSRSDQDLHLLLGVSPSPPIPELGGASIPVAVNLNGNPNFKAEVELSYELGYRLTLSNQASLDITAFYSNYDKLTIYSIQQNPFLSTVPTLHLTQPVYFDNLGKVSTYGFEATTVWQMIDWWRWDTNYSYIKTDSQSTSNPVSPQHKVSLRAAINPIDDVTVDFWLRYNSILTALNSLDKSFTSPTKLINGYVTFDARLAWKVHPSLELSLVGQNLLDDQRLEYLDEGIVQPGAISRGVYGKVALEF
jgi:iron complex outermembrane receptor protein